MKKLNLILMAIITIAITSCSSSYTIQLEDGKLITANTINDVNISFQPNDTVVIRTVNGGRSQYIYGKYVGTLPENSFGRLFDSSSFIVVYEKGIILSN